VNNAGILRDKSFIRCTDTDWDLVQRIHLRGTYKVCKAAWPHFLKQKYGRIINTASSVGLYGNFGQANYSAAKSGIIGLSNTLAIEGRKSNILVNSIAPNAGTRMTATVMPAEMVEALKPDYVAPLVAFLAHEKNSTTGAIFEVGSGWISRVRWQRSLGVGFPHSKKLLAEHISDRWNEITSFDKFTYPTTAQESFQSIYENVSSQGSSKSSSGEDRVENAKNVKHPKLQFSYTDRDVILYNLGIGAKREELEFVYENNENFMAIPSFGVIPAFSAMLNFPMTDVVGDFNPMFLLHGEQFLELKKAIPTSGTLTSEAKLVDVLDKGKNCVLIIGVTTKDSNGDVVCYNEFSNFIRGVSGVGNKASDRGAATASNEPPKRNPDKIVSEKTNENQAALYRLSGDRNPLHIDPEMSKIGGFDVPILHGLCSFGISVKHILKNFGRPKNIKVRFSKNVFPGETLQTEMWKEGRKVYFQVRVLERNVLAITNAAVELEDDSASQTKAKL
jgi:multifunctional beta-oxidation protein